MRIRAFVQSKDFKSKNWTIGRIRIRGTIRNQKFEIGQAESGYPSVTSIHRARQPISSSSIFTVDEFWTPAPPNALRPRPDRIKELYSSRGSVEVLAQNVFHLPSCTRNCSTLER